MRDSPDHAYELYQLTRRLQNAVKDDSPVRCRDIIVEIQDYLRDNALGNEEIQDEIVVELDNTRDEIVSWDNESIPTVAQNRIDRCILRINALSLRPKFEASNTSFPPDEVQGQFETVVEQTDEFDSGMLSRLQNRLEQKQEESKNNHSASAVISILTKYLENSADWQRSKALSLQEKAEEIEQTLDQVDKIDATSEEHKKRIERMRNNVDNKYTFDFDESDEMDRALIVKIGVKRYLNQKQKEIDSKEEFFTQLNGKIENMLEKAKINARKDERDTVLPRDVAAEDE